MVGTRRRSSVRRGVAAMGAMLAVVVIVAVGLPAPSAGAAKPSTLPELQCGVPVTTSVKLSADLTCPTSIVVPDNTPASTIDLGGHTLRVEPTPSCSAFGGGPICTITDRSGEATIKNGTVDGNLGSWFGTGTLVSKVHVTGMVNTGDDGVMVLRRVVVDGGVVQNRQVSIHDSVIHGGISVDDARAATPIDIVGNRITGGIDVFIQFDFDRVGGTISGNRIEGSTGDGISIRGRGAAGMGQLDIVGNTIVGNAGAGLTIEQDLQWLGRYGNGPVTIARNVVRHNGRGIVLDESLLGGHLAGVVDGGGNRARDNAIDPQCVDIRCGVPDPRALPEVMWESPANIAEGVPIGPAQLNAIPSVPGTLTYSPAAGAVPALPVALLSAHFVPDDLVQYQPVDRYVGLRINPLPVTTPQITWPTPADIAFGTPLGPDQLAATAPVAGTFTYTPGAGTLLPVGIHELSVAFTPDDTLHYTTATFSVMLTVVPPALNSVAWADPAPIPYGTPLGPDQLNALSSVPGTFAYHPGVGTVFMPGQHALVADFTPDDTTNHSPIQTVVQIDVLPPTSPPPTVTFDPSLDIPREGFDAPIDVDLADFDGDGVLDVVTTTPGLGGLLPFGGNVRISFGVGDGSFQDGEDFLLDLGDGGHTVAVGDVDGDGNIDLVTADAATKTISVLLGNGDRTFAARVERPAGNGQGDIQLVDIDADGDLDVVESNFVGGTVSVLLGHGDGTFADKVDVRAGAIPLKFAVGDVNGDHHLDLVVPDVLTNIVSILLGNGDGTFQPRRGLPVGLTPTSAALADLDGDGDLDLAVTNLGDSTLSVLTGDGAGGFGPRLDYDSATGPRAVRAGDMNGDGAVDLVTVNDSGSIGVWLGVGDGTLHPRVPLWIGPAGKALALGDLDGDGQLDVVVAKQDQHAVEVALNRTLT